MTTTTHIKRIKKSLREAGLYDSKLDEQIRLTAMQLGLLDKLQESLEATELIETIISAAGTEKKQISPLVQYIEKLFAQITDSFKALGLNYNASSANIRESAKKDSGGIAELMKMMEQ